MRESERLSHVNFLKWVNNGILETRMEGELKHSFVI